MASSLPSNPIELFSGAEVAEFRHAFSRFDKNGDGTITVDEMASVLRDLGTAETSDEDAELMVRELDLDADGVISFSGFLNMISRKMHADAEEEEVIIEAFKAIDADGSGSISYSELRSFLDKVGEHIADEEIDEILYVAHSTTRETDLLDGTGIKYNNFFELFKLLKINV
jgi:calmodulin